MTDVLLPLRVYSIPSMVTVKLHGIIFAVEGYQIFCVDCTVGNVIAACTERNAVYADALERSFSRSAECFGLRIKSYCKSVKMKVGRIYVLTLLENDFALRQVHLFETTTGVPGFSDQ